MVSVSERRIWSAFWASVPGYHPFCHSGRCRVVALLGRLRPGTDVELLALNGLLTPLEGRVIEALAGLLLRPVNRKRTVGQVISQVGECRLGLEGNCYVH